MEPSLHIRRVHVLADLPSHAFGIIPPHMEGTADAETCYKRTSNHPSAYGGYLLLSSLLSSSCESSLRIRGVRESPSNTSKGIGIIPPHMEGTRCGSICWRQASNHPSPYGGYIMFVVWIGTMMESSLRIRRVHSHKGAVESTHRIIPPHTEGT